MQRDVRLVLCTYTVHLSNIGPLLAVHYIFIVPSVVLRYVQRLLMHLGAGGTVRAEEALTASWQ